LLVVLFLSSCEEQYRHIEPFVPSGNRVVLIEEFTGKGCTNCPKGSRELENLLLQFPDNLAVVSIHAGFFADPQFFPLGTFDFRTEEGEDLYDYLGPPVFYPAATIDRTLVSGDRMLGLNQWASLVTEHIQQDPDIDLSLSTNYDAGTRELRVTVSGIGKRTVNGDIRISVMLTESGIVDWQDDAEADPHIVTDYVHKHVLRAMLTASRGDVLDNNIGLGESFTRSYVTVLPGEWAPEKMEVLAFVNVVGGGDFPVIQAVTAHVAE